MKTAWSNVIRKQKCSFIECGPNSNVSFTTRFFKTTNDRRIYDWEVFQRYLPTHVLWWRFKETFPDLTIFNYTEVVLFVYNPLHTAFGWWSPDEYAKLVRILNKKEDQKLILEYYMRAFYKDPQIYYSHLKEWKHFHTKYGALPDWLTEERLEEHSRGLHVIASLIPYICTLSYYGQGRCESIPAELLAEWLVTFNLYFAEDGWDLIGCPILRFRNTHCKIDILHMALAGWERSTSKRRKTGRRGMRVGPCLPYSPFQPNNVLCLKWITAAWPTSAFFSRIACAPFLKMIMYYIHEKRKRRYYIFHEPSPKTIRKRYISTTSQNLSTVNPFETDISTLAGNHQEALMSCLRINCGPGD